MKQSLTKRIVSGLLIVLMVLTMIPSELIPVMHVHAADNINDKYNLIIDFDYASKNNVTSPEDAMALEKNKPTADFNAANGGGWLPAGFAVEKVNDGDYKATGGNLRKWLEDTEMNAGIVFQLQEDVSAFAGDDYDVIEITSDKIIDLNGHQLSLWDARNGPYIGMGPLEIGYSGDQSTTVSDHHSYMFRILNGATLTIIDSSGTEENPGSIYTTGTMINHQKWDFLYYTHRDIFHVADGNLVIYGGAFQAGSQQDQLKSNFSWSKLKEVIGDAVTMGSSILDYTSGIDIVEGAKLDFMVENFLDEENEDTEDDGNADRSDSGATNKKKGENATKDDKKDTPTSAGSGDNATQADQTVAQKQNNKNNGTQDNAAAGDQSGENEADDEKPAKKDKFTELAKQEKNVAEAYLDKDKIGTMVDSAFKLVEGIAGLIGNDERTRATACIQGTVAKLSSKGTLVTYGGLFIGHGSTPNVRNAVIEVELNEQYNNDPKSLHYGKQTGGHAYIYGGTFEARVGANVFNMVTTQRDQKQYNYTKDANGKVVAELVTLPEHETLNMKVLQYDPVSFREWEAGYAKLTTDAQKAAYEAPKPVNTANVIVRNGTFRCYYEVTNMAVLKNKDEGQLCPEHNKEDDCDDLDHHKFTGTAGSVNLGVESFGEDMIKDGRIQIVDVYGQGALVLLDGGEPIVSKNEDEITGRNETYQTEGGFRHYRLFVGDRELRASSYLQAYPNNSADANSSFSFGLRTYWGTGKDQSDMWSSDKVKEEKVWAADMENIRAPYSSNEKYVEFVFDDMEDDGDGISANYYVIPNLKNTDPQGTNLNSSNVWYYNTPVDHNEEPIETRIFQMYYKDGTYQVSGKRVEYTTNIKWFTYKVYRVDPLSRENISESKAAYKDVHNVEPLIEVCYGASPDSLKCKLPLLYLEEQIKKRRPDWAGYQTGEMYRIVFSLEEHLGYGDLNQTDFDNTMPEATTESSILFMCVSNNEQKEETYVDPADGKTKLHYVPDFTALQFYNGKVMAGDNAYIKLTNGQTGMVDWVGDKIFDIYYQWWEVDENGNDIRLLAGTDNIWVAQDTTGKQNHRIDSWIVNADGQGVNGEQYYNTVDPNAENAHLMGSNGLPTKKSDWTYEMLHINTFEECGQNINLRTDPSKPLDMGNNNATWGNTDKCYIPEDMAGKYLQVRMIAVNCAYSTYYDNKQTIKSHVVRVGEYTERTDIELNVPTDADNATLTGKVTNTGSAIEYDYWSEIMSDGTLRPMGNVEKFVSGKKYRYTVRLEPTQNCALSNEHQAYINGNYTTKLNKFEYTMDFTARATLKASLDQKKVVVKEGTKAVLKVNATGDGITYNWQPVSAGAPYNKVGSSITGNYFWDFTITDTNGYVGTHTYKCTVRDKYGNSVELTATLQIVKNDDLYVTTAYLVPGINGDQKTVEEIMSKAGTTNSLYAASRLKQRNGVNDTLFYTTPGSKFVLYATYNVIPEEYTYITSDGMVCNLYNEYDFYGKLLRERTPVEGNITYQWKTSGTTPTGAVSSSQLTTLGTDADYTWTAPAEPGTYYFVIEMTNTITFSNGTTKQDLSLIRFGIVVSDESAPSLSGRISAHGDAKDSMTIELYKDSTTTPVATQTAVGNEAAYSFANLETGTYTVKVTKDCNRVYTATVTVGEGSNIHNVVMVEDHSWTDATCTAPKTCSVCGETEGTVKHNFNIPATCTTPVRCSGCGATKGEPLGHTWNDATCSAPKTCSTCGTTEGSALKHSWTAATCTEPQHCLYCDATQGTALGHNWMAATCTAPKTCYRCMLTEGSTIAHKYVDGTCTECGATEEKPPVTTVATGWSGATQWKLTSDGVMTFTGTGNMKNYGYNKNQPWLAHADKITSVVIENGVTAIGTGAFMGLTKLESVTLPTTGLKTIGEAAFYGCTSLREITIPEGIYTIWLYTFKGCTSLRSVKMPKSLIKVDQGAFENCTSLTYVYFPTNVDIIGSWSFKGCTGLTEVDMTWTNATKIREGAFKNCSSLTTIHLPEKIQTLGDSCFYGIGATSFTVPETVTSIEAWCFARAKLTKITFKGNAPSIGEGAFNKITLTAWYNSAKTGWTSAKMQNYGGTVTWKAQ